MGLDMYAFTTTTALTQRVDFDPPEDAVELHYWRKHPDLHGWMERLYFSRGGGNPDFNLEPVALNCADLDRLEKDVEDGKLPATSGFFFGQSDCHERLNDDLDFIAKARDALMEGKAIFYVAWW